MCVLGIELCSSGRADSALSCETKLSNPFFLILNYVYVCMLRAAHVSAGALGLQEKA